MLVLSVRLSLTSCVMWTGCRLVTLSCVPGSVLVIWEVACTTDLCWEEESLSTARFKEQKPNKLELYLCKCIQYVYVLPVGLSVLAEQLVWELLSVQQLEVGWSLTRCHLSEGNPLKMKVESRHFRQTILLNLLVYFYLSFVMLITGRCCLFNMWNVLNH